MPKIEDPNRGAAKRFRTDRFYRQYISRSIVTLLQVTSLPMPKTKTNRGAAKRVKTPVVASSRPREHALPAIFSPPIL